MMRNTYYVRISIAALISLAACSAQYAPDPGFCKMVAQCQDPPPATTPTSTPDTPIEPDPLPSTGKDESPPSNHPSSSPSREPSPTDKQSTHRPTTTKTSDSVPSPSHSSSHSIPRPSPPTGLVSDPNGPLRCREVPGHPSDGLQQQLGPGEHNCAVVPGSYDGRIPCSSALKQKPCLGALRRNWDYAKLEWSDAYPRSGWPKPWTLPSDAYSAGPVILEIVDWQYQTSHYRILVDETVVDESDEEGFQNENLVCDRPELCVDKGFGHAFAHIPRSSSQVVVENTDGKTVFNSGNAHAYEQFAWRLWEPCRC